MIIGGIAGNSEAVHNFGYYFGAKEFRVLVLNGPSYIGKRTFARNWLTEQVEAADFFEPDTSISGAREVKSFFEVGPLFSNWKIALVDNADRLSEPAQDVFLKILEEPPPKARVVFITEDYSALLPALRSRLQHVIQWHTLYDQEMDEFIESSEFTEDKNARLFCGGRPGLYNFLAGKSEPYFKLYEEITKLISSEDPLFRPIPEIILNLKNKRSIEKDAAAQVVRLAAQNYLPTKIDRAFDFYRFAAILLRQPAASAEIHWQKAALGL